MLRASDTPTTVTGQLKAHGDQITELARAQAQGTQTVLNDAGHQLQLNPQNPNPLLVAQGGNDAIDSALGFSSGTLQVTSQDGQNWRDIEASGLVLHDTVTAPGASIGSAGVTSTGPLNSGDVNATRITSTGLIRGPSAQIDGAINSAGVTATTVNAGTGGVFSTGIVQTPDQLRGNSVTAFDLFGVNSTQTYNLSAPGSVTLAGRAWNAVVNVVDTLYNWWEALPSGATLKQGFAEVDDADADALLAAPVQRWSFDPEAWLTEEPLPPQAEGPLNLVDRRPDKREHCGPVAEDVPEIMQTVDPDGRRGIDIASYLGVLLRICQRQEQRIQDLSARVVALEAGKESPRGA